MASIKLSLLSKPLQIASWVLLASMLAVFGAEFTSRLDDWLVSDIPFFANPNREYDLIVVDDAGPHGRPQGRYQRWQLNEFGFRGPEIHRQTDKTRIALLGASETFGLYESSDMEYAAQLRRRLKSRGETQVEVFNAAVAGMALPTLTTYWTNWVSKFHPAVAFIYPSPQFYLDEDVPAHAAPDKRQLQDQKPGFQSRFLSRLLTIMSKDPWLRYLRARWTIHRFFSKHADLQTFDDPPPEDRLQSFTKDLEALALAVERDGATPVLITPPFKVTNPLRDEDGAELYYFRTFFPRATERGLVAFQLAAQKAIRDIGHRHGWRVVDAAARLNGKRELFGDPVHFNDAGSSEIGRASCRERV